MIRPVNPDDAQVIADIYNHYIVSTIITFEETTVTAAEIQSRIAEVTASLPWIVLEEEGAVIGYAYASKWKGRCAFRYSVESSVYVHQNYLGTGRGTALYTKLLESLKAKGLHVVIGGVSLPNEASQSLHEKLGFEKVGHFSEVGFKFNRWIDVGYWEKVL